MPLGFVVSTMQVVLKTRIFANRFGDETESL